MTDKELIMQAVKVREQAYAPYSRFRVGAALLTSDGKVYTGCNVENASFGITCCAERTALFKAVSEGKRTFTAIAVVGGADSVPDTDCFPCGVCRQALCEFCGGDFRVITGTVENFSVFTLAELMPHSFRM